MSNDNLTQGDAMADPTDLSTYNLTPDQKRIALVLADAAERAKGPGLRPGNGVRLVCTQGPQPIRETSTGAALVRKGLALRLSNGNFVATTEGVWIGDALRVEDRLGRIPARRRPRS